MVETRAVYGDIAKDGSVLNRLTAFASKPACATRTCGTADTERRCLCGNDFLLQMQQQRLAVSNGEPYLSGALHPFSKAAISCSCATPSGAVIAILTDMSISTGPSYPAASRALIIVCLLVLMSRAMAETLSPLASL